MSYPKLIDIATKNVITITAKRNVKDAITLMQEHNIRDVIVEDGKGYKIFTSSRLLELQMEAISLETPLEKISLPTLSLLNADAYLLDALALMRENGDYLCLEASGVLMGIVSYSDIAKSLDPKLLAESQKVEDMLNFSQVLRIKGDVTIRELLPLLAKSTHKSAIIETPTQSGIVTQKDIIKVIHDGLSLERSVAEIMSTPLFCIKSSMKIIDALRLSKEKRFKRIVVEDDKGSIVGIISQKDMISHTTTSG